MLFLLNITVFAQFQMDDEHVITSGETGHDKKGAETGKVEDKELPPESTAIHTRGPELICALGADVDTGASQQSGNTTVAEGQH